VGRPHVEVDPPTSEQAQHRGASEHQHDDTSIVARLLYCRGAMTTESLTTTTEQFLDSLLASKTHHTLCLNIADPGFEAERVAADYAESKGRRVARASEPTPNAFGDLLGDLGGKVAIVTFDDLDKHPQCLDLLSQHAAKPDPGGRLVIVSRNWNSTNTPRERELRKHCLFYQQSLAHKPKDKSTT